MVRELLSGAWFGSLLFVSAVAGRQSDFCRGRVALWSVVLLIHIIPALLVESLLSSDVFSLLVGGQLSVVGELFFGESFGYFNIMSVVTGGKASAIG